MGRSPWSQLSRKFHQDDQDADIDNEDDEDGDHHGEPVLTDKQPGLAGQLSVEGSVKSPEEVLPDYY